MLDAEEVTLGLLAIIYLSHPRASHAIPPAQVTVPSVDNHPRVEPRRCICIAAAPPVTTFDNYLLLFPLSIAIRLSPGRNRPGFRFGKCVPSNIRSFSVGSART